MARFLPPAARGRILDLLREHHLPLSQRRSVHAANIARPAVRNGKLVVGDVAVPIATPSNPELVPRPLYFDNPRHSAAMQAVARDVTTGERHLLLIGNQVRIHRVPPLAVPRLPDWHGLRQCRAWEKTNWRTECCSCWAGSASTCSCTEMCVSASGAVSRQARPHASLCAQTTVQSLTLSPSLREGRVVWEDSPLVRAVTHGRTLVVDEADKAPLEVVCILKVGAALGHVAATRMLTLGATGGSRL